MQIDLFPEEKPDRVPAVIYPGEISAEVPSVPFPVRCPGTRRGSERTMPEEPCRVIRFPGEKPDQVPAVIYPGIILC